MKKQIIFIIAVLCLLVIMAGCQNKQEYAAAPEDIADSFPIQAIETAENPQFADSTGPFAIFHTTAGDITVLLYPKQAPKAVENFISLAKEGYYDKSMFQYIVKNSIVQGGKSADNQEKSSYGEPFEDEFHDELHHFHGALAMANASIDSNESQFYFIANQEIPEDERLVSANMYMNELVRQRTLELNKLQKDTKMSEEEIKKYEEKLNQDVQSIGSKGVPDSEMERYQKAVDVYMNSGGAYHLDYSHTVFGQVVKGLNVVDSMSQVLVDIEKKPKQDIILESIEIVDHL